MNNTRTEKTVLLLVLLLFTILPFVRLYPYTNNLPELLAGTDDWNFYAKNALEIKRGGFLMPHFHEAYGYPGGFFYNYFVAACFALFGESPVPVYVVQSILLGGAAVLIYLAFRSRMKKVTRWIFLLCLTAFALLDVSKDYSARLLSENLAVFTIAAFVYCLQRALESKRLSWQMGAPFFLIISMLTRPVLLPFGFVFVLLLFWYFFQSKTMSLPGTVLFAAAVLLGMSLIALRNYFVCGQFIFLPTLGVYGSGLQVEQFSVAHMAKKVLFMFGYLPALSGEYRIRPHWMLLWAAYLGYLFFRKKQFWKFGMEELPVHAFIFVYCGLSLIFVTVDSYGFRAFIPVTLIILPFSLMAVERTIERRKTEHNKGSDREFS
jgi:hypothetical protein